MKKDGEVVREDIYEIGEEVISHQHDYNGNHRIVVCSYPPPQQVGEWTGYIGIAACGDYRATTDYQSSLPRLFKITEGTLKEEAVAST